MTVTDEAAELLAARLAGRGPNECFRLTLEEGELDVSLDVHQPGDEVVRHDDKIVLAMEPELVEELEQLILDVDRTDSGEQALILLERPR
jgi:hypothetical protein